MIIYIWLLVNTTETTDKKSTNLQFTCIHPFLVHPDTFLECTCVVFSYFEYLRRNVHRKVISFFVSPPKIIYLLEELSIFWFILVYIWRRNMVEYKIFFVSWRNNDPPGHLSVTFSIDIFNMIKNTISSHIWLRPKKNDITNELFYFMKPTITIQQLFEMTDTGTFILGIICV